MSGTASFTPSNAIDPSKERDWSAQLGMLDWDSTNIVFTKRSLLEFLKYAGVTVDPNFTTIQKLPHYAKFGKISGNVEAQDPSPTSLSEPSSTPTTTSDFKPTRRVRDAPGGTHTNIFQNEDGDALATAPTKGSSAVGQADPSPVPEAEAQSEAAIESNSRTRKPTSSVASLWDAQDDSNKFKPTRRVREMPGGKDSISGLF